MSEFGVVAFDNTEIHESGWACDGKEYFRISSTSELDTDTAWICNLDYNEMFETGLHSNARFRRTNYLSENFMKVAFEESIVKPYDLGRQFNLQDNNIRDRVVIMQSFYENVMKIVKHFHGMPHAYAEELPSALRRLNSFDPVVNEGLFMALEQSDVPYVSTERNFMDFKDYEILTWHESKLEHAKNILNNFFPVQDFGEWIRKKVRISNYNEALEYIDNVSEDGLALYRVKMKDFDEEINKITNFGSGKDVRFWITDAELKFLIKYLSNIEISDCFICPKVSRPTDSLNILMNELSPIHGSSYSIGLYAQNLWLSYTKAKRPPIRFTAGKSVYNVVSPFINAYDRILLQQKSLILSNLGAVVIGYGRGKIQFAIHKSMLKDPNWINEALNKTKLMPLSMEFEHEDIEIVNPRDPVNVLQGLWATGNTKKILELDKEVVNRVTRKQST